MVDFRENLLPGSLDGVPFEVQRHRASFGRRVASYEFIDQDQPSNRDLGRKQRQFSLDIFVLEPNYFEKREDLIDVVEKRGTKRLSHPYLGELMVESASLELVEDDKEGGIARFTLTCVEAEKVSDAILITVDTSVAKSADFALAQAQTDYAQAVPSVPDFRDEFIGAIRNVTTALRKTKGKITTALGVIDDLDGAIESLDDAVASLINTPTELASQLVGLILSVLSLVGQVIPRRDQPGIDEPAPTAPRHELLLEGMADVLAADTSAAEPPNLTPRRVAQQNRHDALAALVEIATVASATRVAVEDIEYDAASDATTTRDSLLTTIDTVDGRTVDSFEALRNLGGAASVQFGRVLANLPEVEVLQFKAGEPALVTAYRRYRNADREAEVIARNRTPARDPLAIQADVDIELLVT